MDGGLDIFGGVEDSSNSVPSASQESFVSGSSSPASTIPEVPILPKSPKKKSWNELREDVRVTRRRLWGLGRRLPHSFTFRKMGGKTRVYFMSSPINSRDNSVFALDVPDDDMEFDDGSVWDPSKGTSGKYHWFQILASGFQGGEPPTKAELLSMERKRMTPTGIAAYEFHEETAKFVFTASSSLFQCVDDNMGFPLTPLEIQTPKTSGARLNAEICPDNPDLIAFINNGDLWVVNSAATGHEVRLTFARNNDLDIEEDPMSAGYPSYIMQEEFNRFQGFWWQPNCDNKKTFRILYEEVDESNVNLVSLLTMPGREPEKYRFPTPGTANAISRLKIIQFQVATDGKIVNVENIELPYPITQHFTWAEYIARVGWTPDGKYIWTQLLNRQQQRLELILFPFLIPDKPENGIGLDEENIMSDDTPSSQSIPSAPAYVIFCEETHIWINVHDMLTFFPTEEPNTVTFLWASEETGYRHLYLIKSELRPSLTQPWLSCKRPALYLSPHILMKVALTAGDWEVMNCNLACHYSFGLIFFMGLKDSPIERHLYVVSLKQPGEISRLTQPGHSYSAFFNSDCSLVILTYSSTKSPPVCRLCRVKYTDSSIYGVTIEPLTYFLKTPHVDPSFPFPEIHPYKMETGEDIFAMVYKPFNFDPEKKYPTVLNVYGGPEVQLVFNSFRGTGQLWLYLLASQGYCVVAIDSRGSHHRGVFFESHIRGRMGTVELDDQVEVLSWLADKEKYIDMERVGIYGWSYGGYLSLMGLVQYPELFKACVAGAPVTSWELYDTGYTERYMDLPQNNPTGYRKGSVLTYAQQFPDEVGRLLLVHGLNDENVHFVHTAELLNALIRWGKPYQLQLYPSERHSLRHLDASEHYETMLLSFLQQNLKLIG